MSERCVQEGVVPATCVQIYDAWVEGAGHAAMTGADATSDASVGGEFTAWGGYIRGRWLELEPGRRIAMSWRTSAFPEGAPDSHVDVALSEARGGTRVRIVHTEIPDGQADDYRQGWIDHYLNPMRNHWG